MYYKLSQGKSALSLWVMLGWQPPTEIYTQGRARRYRPCCGPSRLMARAWPQGGLSGWFRAPMAICGMARQLQRCAGPPRPGPGGLFAISTASPPPSTKPAPYGPAARMRAFQGIQLFRLASLRPAPRPEGVPVGSLKSARGYTPARAALTGPASAAKYGR